MNLKELKETVDRLMRSCELGREDPEKITVGIMVKRVGQIGSQPWVGVKAMNLGFDWDKGKLLISAESDLREIDRDEFKALMKAYDELGEKYMKKQKKYE